MFETASILILKMSTRNIGLPRWPSGKEPSCLGNPMDKGTWWATVVGVKKELDTNLANKQQQLEM